MRPLALEIQGVRSYREHTVIEFPQDGGLIGIIGDTGSGKSSILEAMLAALYARTSWKRGDLSDLRSSSEHTMHIVLTFEVDGRRWRVTRTSSRDNYPPSVHELVCLDDETELYSLREAVNSKIVSLLGLTYDVFKSAVILPQGNFERLLKAGEAARVDILMEILRLNELHVAREIAVQSQLALTTLLGRADVLRARLGDPSQEAAGAAASKAQATHRRNGLRSASARLKELDKHRTEAEAQAKHSFSASTEITKTLADDGATLTALADIVGTIEAKSEALGGRQRGRRSRSRRARRQAEGSSSARRVDRGSIARRGYTTGPHPRSSRISAPAPHASEQADRPREGANAIRGPPRSGQYGAAEREGPQFRC